MLTETQKLAITEAIKTAIADRNRQKVFDIILSWCDILAGDRSQNTTLLSSFVMREIIPSMSDSDTLWFDKNVMNKTGDVKQDNQKSLDFYAHYLAQHGFIPGQDFWLMDGVIYTNEKVQRHMDAIEANAYKG